MSTEKELVTAVQTRLAHLGYYGLRIDGDAGVGTREAIVRFKKVHGLLARPYIGTKTLYKMFGAAAITAPKEKVIYEGEPRWLTEARSLLGTRETPGPGNNPVIMDWAGGLDQWYPGDDVAWCGLFIAHCMAVGAPQEPQKFNRLSARNWLQYGEECDEALGAVCVLWRTHKTESWHGHVFNVTGQSKDAIRGIGGNQSDAVSESWFPRDRVLGFRKPVGANLPVAPRLKTGTMSVREN